MPKYPNFASRVKQMTGSAFEKYAPRIREQGEAMVRLHIGDTHIPTSYPLPVSEKMLTLHPDHNRYCNTFGIDSLRDALAEKLQERNSLRVERDNILITTGATNALNISMMSLVEPGESVLVLTPAWPLFFGMVKVAGGEILEAPFYTKLTETPDMDIPAYLEQFITENTVAIYINTPNNPSGKVLTQTQIKQLAEFAQTKNLWIISDEAYDGLTFNGLSHISIASLPGMFDRTLSTFTFSKSFMFAGLRLGYLVANPTVIAETNKIMVHQIYGASTLAQQMMLEPVKTIDKWLPQVRDLYQHLRDVATKSLTLNIEEPEAGYFAFFSIEKCLRGRDYWQVIETCFDSGVSIAPGNSFGSHFEKFIRICFTGEPEERLRSGIERLNKALSS